MQNDDPFIAIVVVILLLLPLGFVVTGTLALYRKFGFWRASVAMLALAALAWWGPPGMVHRSIATAGWMRKEAGGLRSGKRAMGE